MKEAADRESHIQDEEKSVFSAGFQRANMHIFIHICMQRAIKQCVICKHLLTVTLELVNFLTLFVFK